MFQKKQNQEDRTNFWISYADLMAGLLFVFILLIGAIIVKSTLLKSSLKEKESALELQAQTLNNQQELLKKQSINIDIKDEEITKLRNLLAQREAALDETNKTLILTQNSLTLKSNEIERLNQLLLAQNSKIDEYSEHIILLQNLVDEYNQTQIQQQIELDKYKGEVILLSNQLSKKKERLKLNEEKLLQLLQAIDQKQTKYDKLLLKLQKQKARIKSLTGIKLKVIAELKKALGKSINIDKESGSLRLSSNILFDKGSSKLKEEAKEELKSTFISYAKTLINNKKIYDHLDKIIIEGHTDSDGGYLYNLDLSQRRAYAVMSYLSTLEYIKQHNIQEKLVASGRSDLDTIMRDDVEDKEASRRIEIKFRLKNEDAMHEIERILDAD